MFEWFGKVSYCPHTKVSNFARHLKDGHITREEADRLHEPYRTETSDFASLLLLWRAWSKARRNLKTQGKLRRFWKRPKSSIWQIWKV